MVKKLKMIRILVTILMVTSSFSFQTTANAAETEPYGLASLDQLERLPYIGTQTMSGMESTFNRAGGYHDSLGYLYETATDRVYADLKGPGVITRIWGTNLAGDDHIKIYFDGETNPRINMTVTDFFSGTNPPFRSPLVANNEVSSGGWVSYLPLAFNDSVRVAIAKRAGLEVYIHVGYQLYSPDTTVTTWTSSESGSQDSTSVRNKWNNVGIDPKSDAGNTTVSNTINLSSGTSQDLLDINGPKSISSIKIKVPGVTSQGTMVTDDGRAHMGYSQFTAAISSSNQGVVLKRRLDYSVGNQKANVYIDGQLVGEWFDEGSCTAAIYDTFNKWKDSTFTIPSSFTSGKSSIVIRVSYVSSDVDWNEFYYWVYSTVGGSDILTDQIDVYNSTSETNHNYSINNASWAGGSRTFYYPPDDTLAGILNQLQIKIFWDNEQTPSVNAPLGSFFATGQYGIALAPQTVMVGFDANDFMYMYFPMPFESHAKIQLANTGANAVNNIQYEIKYKDFNDSFDNVGYFKTEFKEQSVAQSFNHDVVLIDKDGAGSIVGIVYSAKGPETQVSKTMEYPDFPTIYNYYIYYFMYVEGDEKVYIDGERTPSIHGTGVEDTANAGYGWNRGYDALPLYGLSSYKIRTVDSQTYQNTMAFHRLYLSDRINFNNHIRYTFEHGLINDSAIDTLGTLVYYYHKPEQKSVLTDKLDMGNTASENNHSYSINNQTDASTNTYTYEGDYNDAYLVDNGRAFTGYSQFTVKINPSNNGVMLRKRYDQNTLIQNAKVYVDGSLAGTWYAVGGNANSGWKDAEFLIPASFTSGKSSIQIKIENDSTYAWNEYWYDIYTLLSGAGQIPIVNQSTNAIANHDFESGDLSGWTILSGDAFTPGDVTTDQSQDGVAFLQSGSYHYWGYKNGGDGRTGSMRTDNFVLGGNGLIDLLVGGGRDVNNLYIALVRASDDAVLFKATGRESEQYSRVFWDASQYIGTACYLKAVDQSSGSWGHINLDDINIPVSTMSTNLEGTWSALNGSWCDIADGKQASDSGDAFYLSSQTGTNFTYEGDLKVTNSGAAGLIFRANADATQFYCVNVDYTNQKVMLWGPGVAARIHYTTINTNTVYHLKVVANGSNIKVYFDGGVNPVIDTTDTTYTSGRFGLNVWNGTSVFQNVNIGFNTNLPGTWTSINGTWSDTTAGIGGEQGTCTSDAFYLSQQTGTDFTYEGDLKVTNNGAAGLIFRANADATQFYCANVDYTNQKVMVWGPGVTARTYYTTISTNTVYHLKVVVNGSSIKVYFNGEANPVIDTTDTTYASGQYGINVWNGTSVFQNIYAQ